MPTAGIAFCHAPPLQAAPVNLAALLQKSDGDEAPFVGGDLSKVVFVPSAQVGSYHNGMRLVIVVALFAGAILFAVGLLLGFPIKSS